MIVSRCTPDMRSIDLIELPSERRERIRVFFSFGRAFIAFFRLGVDNPRNERYLRVGSVSVHAGMDFRACGVLQHSVGPLKSGQC